MRGFGIRERVARERVALALADSWRGIASMRTLLAQRARPRLKLGRAGLAPYARTYAHTCTHHASPLMMM